MKCSEYHVCVCVCFVVRDAVLDGAATHGTHPHIRALHNALSIGDVRGGGALPIPVDHAVGPLSSILVPSFRIKFATRSSAPTECVTARAPRTEHRANATTHANTYVLGDSEFP